MSVVEDRKRKLFFDRLATIAVGLLMAVAGLFIGLRVFGYNIYTVMSGSMEPTLPVGAMIYVKAVDYRDLKVGDVISYVADSSNMVVTHRIVDIETDMNNANEVRFRTQGDANNVADGQTVHYRNVLGVPTVVIPFLGYLVFYLQRPPGIYLALIVGTLLLVWAFKPEMTKKKRRRVAEADAI